MFIHSTGIKWWTPAKYIYILSMICNIGICFYLGIILKKLEKKFPEKIGKMFIWIPIIYFFVFWGLIYITIMSATCSYRNKCHIIGAINLIYPVLFIICTIIYFSSFVDEIDKIIEPLEYFKDDEFYKLEEE